MNSKDFLVYTIVISVLGLGTYFVINALNYFDPVHACYIDVDRDILRGNRKTILEAIHKIKRESRQDYKIMCKYVDKISENFCIASDWHLDPSWRDNSIGKSCYIRGSKTIYLFPAEEYSQDVVSARAKAIKKYSNFSREFWEHKK